MSEKRKRSNNELDNLPRKKLNETKSDEILQIVRKFQENISDYNKKFEDLNKFEKYLDNPDEYIYDECNELRRLIQLETEELIANIKQLNNIEIDQDILEPNLIALIDNVNKQSELLITQVDNHEKLTKTYWKNNIFSKKSFIKEKNKLKQFSELFIQNWLNKLTELRFDDESMKQAANKMEEYQTKMNDIFTNIKMYIFNNNCIELQRHNTNLNDNNLNYYIFTKSRIIYNKDNQFNLNNIYKDSNIQEIREQQSLKSYSFDFLNDDKKYLVFFHSNDDHQTKKFTYIVIYDSIFKIILNEKLIDNIECDQVYLNKNLIIFRRKTSLFANYNLVLMNHELEILKEIQIGTIRGTGNEFIYASQMDNNNTITTDIQVLDWSLEITKTIHLQDENPQQPFYIQNLNFFKAWYNIEFKFFPIVNHAYFLRSNYELFYFEKNGYLYKHFEDIDQAIGIVNSDHFLLIFNHHENKYSVHNKSSNIKEIKIINLKLLKKDAVYPQIKFDSNERIYFYEAKHNLLHIPN
jgi:hypothetical protein